MGRIYKFFEASTRSATIRAKAKVDTGADVSMIRLDAACHLGLNIQKAKIAAMCTAGDAQLLGFSFPVKLTIGDRVAKIAAFVPVYQKTGKDFKRIRGHNLIGADFFQETKAKLDYSKSHYRVFSGVVDWPPDWKTCKVRKSEIQYLRKRARCPHPRRKH